MAGEQKWLRQNHSSNNDCRYYHLNYCYSLEKSAGKIKTIECRLFPIFKKRDSDNRPIIALKVVAFLYNLFNNYLATQKPEKSAIQNLKADFGEEIMEESICV
jgi:hypothetical protein